MDGHLVLAQHLNIGPGLGAPVQGQAGVLAPLPDSLDGLGVEGLAIVEGDALPQLEGVDQRVVGNGPVGGQHVHDLGLLVKGQQALVHGVGDLVGVAVAGDVGVQVGGVVGHGDDKVIVRRLAA